MAYFWLVLHEVSSVRDASTVISHIGRWWNFEKVEALVKVNRGMTRKHVRLWRLLEQTKSESNFNQ